MDAWTWNEQKRTVKTKKYNTHRKNTNYRLKFSVRPLAVVRNFIGTDGSETMLLWLLISTIVEFMKEKGGQDERMAANCKGGANSPYLPKCCLLLTTWSHPSKHAGEERMGGNKHRQAGRGRQENRVKIAKVGQVKGLHLFLGFYGHSCCISSVTIPARLPCSCLECYLYGRRQHEPNTGSLSSCFLFSQRQTRLWNTQRHKYEKFRLASEPHLHKI